jgi:peptidase M23-like protein
MRCIGMAIAACVVVMFGPACVAAEVAQPVPASIQAPVEARVPFPPTWVMGTDGLRHLAYEIHLTNYYGDTGPLTALDLKIRSDGTDEVVAQWSATDIASVARPAPKEGQPLRVEPGKQATIYVFLSPRTGQSPHVLRHVMHFDMAGKTALLDGVRVEISSAPVMQLGPPFKGGRWVAHEGPGNAHSHHWGSIVVANGDMTIPQRYAVDLVGVDASGHAMRSTVKDLAHTTHADWFGYGTDVLAVADGVVTASRNTEPDHAPLQAQPEPSSLTLNGLFGNYVVLQVAPGTWAGYAHLKPGSVLVKPGDHVKRGQVIGRLGQSGNSAAPHLHFQLANRPTFEGSEGVPFVFDAFRYEGTETEAQLFGQGDPWKPTDGSLRHNQMPLSDTVIDFSR